MHTETFIHRIAIIGNPTVPDTRFDDSQMRGLKERGFNTVQLNIAWGSRPPGEPLNMEDVLTLSGDETEEIVVRREELKRRALQCKRFGLRTIFHFGAPHVKGLYDLLASAFEKDQAVEACIEKPEVHAHYGAMVERLATVYPEVDDILVYTYDQEAWLCSEFSSCPRCKGKPLHERLPRFLQTLRDAWAKHRPEGMMWWEPWELSAGQVYAMLPHLPRRNFGLMLHSNIAEVQMTRPIDTWFRNTARMAAQLGLPVAGELFMCSANEEITPLQHVVAPQLIWEQVNALASVPGVSGVKEYFGTRPDINDPDLSMAGLVFAEPKISMPEALEKLAAPCGAAKQEVLAAWQAMADGLKLFPWDTSWRLRSIDQQKVWHDWKPFTIRGHVCDSPSWVSTRRALFMITENEVLHPWFVEDVSLRFQAAGDCFEQATASYERALPLLPESLKADIILWRDDAASLMRITRSYALHGCETLVARHLRDAMQDSGALPPALVGKMRGLLERDAVNQAGESAPKPASNPSAQEMLREFDQNPARWLGEYLL